MHTNRSRGFTLIELLVVIAIIGILSAVVLASLNTARSKGSDAAVQSDLNAIQTQAEIYYSSNSNSYGTQAAGTTLTACVGGMFGDPTVSKAFAGANTSNGGAGIYCNAAGSTYVVAAKLVSPTSAAYWCVDSTGAAKQVTGTMITTGTACP